MHCLTVYFLKHKSQIALLALQELKKIPPPGIFLLVVKFLILTAHYSSSRGFETFSWD